MKNDLYHLDYQIAGKRPLSNELICTFLAQYKDNLQSIQPKNKDSENEYWMMVITAVIVTCQSKCVNKERARRKNRR